VRVLTRRHDMRRRSACIGGTLSGGNPTVETPGWGSWALGQTRDTSELRGCAGGGASACDWRFHLRELK